MAVFFYCKNQWYNKSINIKINKMSKVLKIIGIIIGSIIVLAIFLSFLVRNTMMGGNSSNFGGGENFSAPMSAGLPSSSISDLVSPMRGKSIESAVDVSGELPADSSVDKKMIKSGNLNLQVEKVDVAADKISQIAKGNGGDVFSSNIRQSKSNVKSGTIAVKVPVANFEKAFAELKKVATLIINESTSGQDVTEQYTDLQAQLKNKQAEEQTFVRILDQAGKMDDVLAVTREISRVRGEIERLQGRIKFMDSQTDMSTISVSLTEDTNITVVDSWRPWQIVKEAFNSLIKNLQGFINFIIRLIIVVIPILLIWVIVIMIFYKIGRKIYLKIKNRNTSQQV